MLNVVLLLLLVTGSRLAAQTLGLPFSYHSVTRGVGAAVDVGGNDAGVRTVAATGVLALGEVTIDSVHLALFDVSGSIASIFGPHGAGSAVAADVNLLDWLGLGIDRSRWEEVTRLHVQLAAALPLVACGDSKTIFEVYAVPLWNFERVDRATGASWVPSWGSVDLGVLLESRSGLGIQLTIGGLAQRTTSDPFRRFVMGAGLHFSPHSVAKAMQSTGSHAPRGCSFILFGKD